MHDDSDLKALKKKWREAAAWRDVLTSISSLAPVSVFSGSFHRVFNYAPLFWPPMDHRRNTNYRVTKRWFTLPNFLIPILNGFHPRQNIFVFLPSLGKDDVTLAFATWKTCMMMYLDSGPKTPAVRLFFLCGRLKIWFLFCSHPWW